MVLDAIFKLVGVHMRKMTQQLMQTIWGGDASFEVNLQCSSSLGLSSSNHISGIQLNAMDRKDKVFFSVFISNHKETIE
ncbi:hypothetical protein ACB092_07G131300 [Castanea dentata]